MGIRLQNNESVAWPAAPRKSRGAAAKVACTISRRGARYTSKDLTTTGLQRLGDDIGKLKEREQCTNDVWIIQCTAVANAVATCSSI